MDAAGVFYAHSGVKVDQSDWQPLQEHLRNVAKMARRFAEEARLGNEEFALWTN